MDKSEEVFKGLQDLDCPVEHFDIWFIYLIYKKLDADTRESWAISQENVEGFSTYASLRKFLESRIHSLENAHGISKIELNENIKGVKDKKVANVNTSQSESVLIKVKSSKKFNSNCFVCGEKHFPNKCVKFREMSVIQRRDIVIKNKRCFICFSHSHSKDNCDKKWRCFICNKDHNALLHVDESVKKSQAFSTSVQARDLDIPADKNSDSSSVSSNDTDNSVNGLKISISKKLVLLATANILLQAQNGEFIPVRALIDPGAESSIVSKRVVSSLALKSFKSNITVKGSGEVVAAKTVPYCNLILKSSLNESFLLEFLVLIKSELFSKIPQKRVNFLIWDYISGLKLSDPEFIHPLHIKCI